MASYKPYAEQRVRRYQPGPYKRALVGQKHAGQLKGRQFGPGPNPKVGPENKLISGIR